MLIFIDTEFCRFNCGMSELISLGAITDRGQTWYGVNAQVPLDKASSFVIEEVMPLIDDHPATIKGDLCDLADSFSSWLDSMNDCLGEEEGLYCVVDYSGDWYLMTEMLAFYQCWPKRLHPSPVYLLSMSSATIDYADLERLTHALYATHQVRPHNALSDAIVNFNIWKSFP